MAFVSDSLIDGRALRILTVVADATRENVGVRAARSFSGIRLVEALDAVAMQRGGYPTYLQADNGPEMRSAAVSQWVVAHKVHKVFIDSGKPFHNGFCESFNSTLRTQCLNRETLTATGTH
jgi:putative transposase